MDTWAHICNMLYLAPENTAGKHQSRQIRHSATGWTGEGICPSRLRIQMIKDNKATAGSGLGGTERLCCASVVCTFSFTEGPSLLWWWALDTLRRCMENKCKRVPNPHLHGWCAQLEVFEKTKKGIYSIGIGIRLNNLKWKIADNWITLRPSKM